MTNDYVRDPSLYAGVNVEKFLQECPNYATCSAREFAEALKKCGVEIVEYDQGCTDPKANPDGKLRLWKSVDFIERIFREEDKKLLDLMQKGLNKGQYRF